MKAKYVNPFTDFGFKKLFGEEASKPLLMDFLNAILPEESKIAALSFKNTEQLGITQIERKAVYDIYCENERGEKFIVELQKAKQNFFKERTVYYSTFPIREQAEKGVWDYNLQAVYCIGILDFTFNDYGNDPQKNEVLHTIKLKNQHGITFYDKLTYIYLEMPNFTLPIEQLETRLDTWLYFIKHLEDFEVIPAIFKDTIFLQAFEKAELAAFTLSEWDAYEANLKIYRDWKGVFDTAISDGEKRGVTRGLEIGEKRGLEIGEKLGLERGLEIGQEQERIKIAQALKTSGIAPEIIQQTTGLPLTQIQQL
ncbi:MAG: Rpn family recombination-promoting nuclease/putative transposase [Candidatus Kapaibacterium sp.]|nr:MAG: Rpn family recombination-promoting nuclease/putative transposase [Candidatus Kapabacteria bacterium]